MVDVVDLFNICLFIQENLEADLSLVFLAQTAGLSRFRFHRVFKAWLGETLHDYVTRQRMERAAFELSYPLPRSNRRSVKAIAFASGYKSLSSFSHAFSSYASVSPRQFRYRAMQQRVRRDVGMVGAYGMRNVRTEGLRASVASGASGQRGVQAFAAHGFNLQVREQEPLRLTVLQSNAPGHRVVGAGNGGREIFGVDTLPGLYARAARRLGIEGQVGMHGTSLSCMCVEVAPDQVPVDEDGRRQPVLTLRGGRYVVIEGHGSVLGLYRAWRRNFDAWLSETGECPRPDRLFIRFPDGAPGSIAGRVRMALCVPLEDIVARRAPRRVEPRRAPTGADDSPLTH